jgi:cell division protein FtsW (lipid II flippase)
MRDFLKQYLRLPVLPILAIMLALMWVGVRAIAAVESVDDSLAGYSSRQAVYAALALAAFFLATLVDYQRIGRWSYVAFGINLLLLVAVLFLPAKRNCHRWIDLKLFWVQPSELAKLSYVMALAWYLRYRSNYRQISGLIAPLLLTLIPAALILREPDLGTSLLLLPTLFFMLLLAGAKLRHLLGTLALAVVLILLPVPQRLAGMAPAEAQDRKALAYWSNAGGDRIVTAAALAKMRYHQLVRIDGWLRQDDPSVIKNKGFQLYLAMVTLGGGGMTGREAGPATDECFDLLPEDQTDFIFSVIGGQWGFLGCMGVMLLYLAILACGAWIAARTAEPYGRLLVVGVMALLFAQIFINIGMTMGMMPITGMTLPFVSYGGSSMVVNGLALGLMVNVALRRAVFLGKKPFEFDD